nr:immunoglobulin light chain junction region [Macaca mulatta]MOW16681.1 immunoglobulin light chain junction region [Macaca mulatta]MOW16816.1 immunoglobulin light chain junction region [Macaca mulatta]MOW18198.1 immunoglobulin light chain junction region [Macaca mulatta]MOW18560.1 immunoglobulin light chain junction region [Macaca mulatta]
DYYCGSSAGSNTWLF